MTSAVVLGKAGWLDDEGIKLAEGWWVVDNEMQGLRCVVGVAWYTEMGWELGKLEEKN